MTVPATTDAAFARDVLNSDRPVLVDFWAPWCGPCRAMEKTLDDVAATRPDVAIIRVNIDENATLLDDYAIHTLPTLLLFRDGNVLSSIAGIATQAEIIAHLDERLASADPGHTPAEYKTIVSSEIAGKIAAAQKAADRTAGMIGASLKTAGGLGALFVAATTGMAACAAVTMAFNAVRGASLYRHKDAAPDLRAGLSGRVFSLAANAGTAGSGVALCLGAMASAGILVPAGLGLAGAAMLAAGGAGLYRDYRSLLPRP